MSQWAEELFGAELITQEGAKATKDALQKPKAVLVYFSAHWCPPCRGFTPVLVEAYKNYTGGDVEVIFVSSDRDQGSFDEYFAEMPWMAVPYADRQRKEAISQKFGVRGIPMLVVLNGDDGKLIVENGRNAVQTSRDLGKSLKLWIGDEADQPAASAPAEVGTPWAVDLFGEFIMTKSGKKATTEVVNDKKLVLIYFSAHWCPPCKGFTPVLAAAYNKYREGDIEVIFVSSDRDQGSFDGYFAEMPWTAVLFADRNRSQMLSQKFEVKGIPTLVVLNGSDGSLVTNDGRSAVQSHQDLHKCAATWVKASKKSGCCVIS
jgi:nucleoredoxin